MKKRWDQYLLTSQVLQEFFYAAIKIKNAKIYEVSSFSNAMIVPRI
jgi:hypothetical protein